MSGSGRDPWGKVAQRYEEAYGPKTASPCWRRAQALAETTSGRVLDLACGAGFELSLFRDGVGIDSSPGMLAAARQRAPDAALVLGDMRQLPFQPHSFSAAYSCFALIHLTKRELSDLLGDLQRVLLPGATVKSMFFAGTGEKDTGFSDLEPSLTAHYSYYQEDELVALFEDAGFSLFVEDDILHEPQMSISCLCVSAFKPAD